MGKTLLSKKPACNKVLRDASHQKAKHKDIVAHLKHELAEWISKLENADGGVKSRIVSECPLCGRTCSRLWNMQRHARTHTTGRLASLIGSLEADRQITHPVFMEVVRALWDNDQMLGNARGFYAARARQLMAKWLKFSTASSSSSSLLTALGTRDCNVVLVFTGDGPEFWARSDAKLESAKPFAKDKYYTMDFANEYARHLFQQGGVYHKAIRTMKTSWQQAGCEVTQLFNRRTETIANLSCELMESAAMAAMRERSRKSLAQFGEYRSVSIDCTYKLALKVVEQNRKQQHNFITVVGTRGSPLGIHDGRGERSEDLRKVLEDAVPLRDVGQVEHISSDVCSKKLFDLLKSSFPNLRGMSLDAMHLCFKVDSFTKKHRVRPTTVGLVMRIIMGKFHVPDKHSGRKALYDGGDLPPLTAEESAAIDKIRNSSMSAREAKKTLKGINPNTPMKSLVEFATLIAALVVVFPERLDQQQEKTTLRNVLIHATQPDRFNWYFNNVKYRGMLPVGVERYMGAGTCRNEQMHARLNSHYRTTVAISRAMLSAELGTWLTAEMEVFLRALRARLTKKVKRVDLLPFATSSTRLFGPAAWKAFIAQPGRLWTTQAGVRKKKFRKGPTSEQVRLLAGLRRKVVKRPAKSVYSAVRVRAQ